VDIDCILWVEYISRYRIGRHSNHIGRNDLPDTWGESIYPYFQVVVHSADCNWWGPLSLWN